MMSAYNQSINTSRQRGAALVVGLVVLLMLTLLGVSSMNMTSLELRIAGNTQNKNIAFQWADSAAEHIFQRGRDNSTPSRRLDLSNTAPQNFSLNAAGVTSGINVVYEGTSSAILCPGISFSLSCNVYQLTSTSTHTASNASSSIVQGFTTVGVARQ